MQQGRPSRWAPDVAVGGMQDDPGDGCASLPAASAAARRPGTVEQRPQLPPPLLRPRRVLHPGPRLVPQRVLGLGQHGRQAWRHEDRRGRLLPRRQLIDLPQPQRQAQLHHQHHSQLSAVQALPGLATCEEKGVVCGLPIASRVSRVETPADTAAGDTEPATTASNWPSSSKTSREETSPAADSNCHGQALSQHQEEPVQFRKPTSCTASRVFEEGGRSYRSMFKRW